MEWREIPGFTGYLINRQGEVKTAKGKVVNTWDSMGYPSVALRYNMKIHRLVLLTFDGPPPEGKNVARHLDGNRKNNNIDNLAWGSYSDNAKDSVKHGTHISCLRPKRPEFHRISDEDVATIRQRSKHEKLRRIANDYPQISYSMVCRIARGLKRKNVDCPPTEILYRRNKKEGADSYE